MKINLSNTFHLWLTACFLSLTTPMVFAADDIRTERVHFRKGANSAVVEASIKGYETVDYVLGARAGQHMNVSLATKHGATYFNILAPGENEVAMFNASVSQNQYEGALPASGDYKIRVYMMRSAARRNEVAHYRLEMIVDGAGQLAAHAPSHDAKVAGTDFHATGNIPCSMGKGQPTGSCAFGVKREGNGSARLSWSPADAAAHVLGFACANDVTNRPLQRKDGQWTRAKGFDTFCPIGPWVETDVDPRDLLLETYVNGERRQHARTSDMIFDPYELVSFVSHVMTLLPGDVVLTGTPSGIGPVRSGDTVEVRIEGIGSLINHVV